MCLTARFYRFQVEEKPIYSEGMAMTDIIDIDQAKKMMQDFADARDWNKFHNPKNLAMSLACEAGELLEIFKWHTEAEANKAKHDPVIKEKTEHELADILMNLIRVADLMDINLSQAVLKKNEINNQRYPADKARGSSKKYTEYLSG